MSTLLLIVALALSIAGEHDHALIVAIAALTFAVLRLEPGALAKMWRDALIDEQMRAQGDDRDRDA